MRKHAQRFSPAVPRTLRYQKEGRRKFISRQLWKKRRRPILVGAAVVGVAALMLSAATTSASAAQAEVSESAALIAALPQYSCPGGYTKLEPTSATRTTHGADVFHYAMTSGPGFNAYVPPVGFDPTTATQAVLSEMNLPSRPAAGGALTSWQQEWGGYKGTEQPELCLSPTPISQPATNSSGSLVQAAHAGLYNWAGEMETNGGFTQASADWYETTSSNGHNEVTWVGIGGYNSSKLIQDGTFSPYNNVLPYAWYEYLPQKQSVIAANTVYPGDTVNAQVIYTSASTGTARFLVQDDGETVLSTSVTDINQDYNPATAEFITERPLKNGTTFEPLGDTGNTYFSNAHGINSGGEISSLSGATSIVMTNDGTTQATNNCTNSDVLQYPLDISGQSFESSFCREGTAVVVNG